MTLKVTQPDLSTPLRTTVLFALLISAVFAHAAETLPPKPDRYFNDYANVVSPADALRFNEQLAQFERETSNQVVVAVFPKMDSDSSIEDYAQRIAQSWAVGQKDRRNGVVLLVFIEDRKMSIQVGYGLEGTLPDVTAFDIRERHIKPHFRSGDYSAGLAEGIDLICKALRGEYNGDGKTDLEKSSAPIALSPGMIVFLAFLFIILMMITSGRRRRRGYGFSGRGGPFIGGFGGGGWGGGSSSGGSFSGFSGGGGSFGGGGSSGSW